MSFLISAIASGCDSGCTSGVSSTIGASPLLDTDEVSESVSLSVSESDNCAFICSIEDVGLVREVGSEAGSCLPTIGIGFGLFWSNTSLCLGSSTSVSESDSEVEESSLTEDSSMSSFATFFSSISNREISASVQVVLTSPSFTSSP